MYEDGRLTDGVKEEEGMTEWEEEKNEISVVHGISAECVCEWEKERVRNTKSLICSYEQLQSTWNKVYWSADRVYFLNKNKNAGFWSIYVTDCYSRLLYLTGGSRRCRAVVALLTIACTSRHIQVVTKIRNGTERNGTVSPTKVRNPRNGTVTFGSLGSMALIMACLLPVNNEGIFRFANG